MAGRNLHAVEETASGATYNKALYWGIIKEEDSTPLLNAKRPDID